MQVQTKTTEQLTAELYSAIAAALGEGWTAEPTEGAQESNSQRFFYHLNGPACRLFIRPTWNKAGRFDVSLSMSRAEYDHKPYNVENPSISVSADKTAAKIAADITRRLLPDAVKVTEEARARVNNYETRKNQDAADNARIAAALGGYGQTCKGRGYAGGEDQRADAVDIRYHTGGCYGKFTASGGSVHIDINSVSVELAEKIAALIAADKKQAGIPDTRVSFKYEENGKQVENSFMFRGRAADEIQTAYSDAVREKAREIMNLISDDWTRARITEANGNSYTIVHG